MTKKSLGAFRTLYNKGRFVQTGARIDMEVEGATFATWHPDRLLTGYSWDALSAAILFHPSGRPRDILLLGLAGGTMIRILRHLIPDVRITAVELDEELVTLAARKMHLDVDPIHLHIGDAYAYLQKARKRYDVILDDVYLSGKADVYRPETVNAHTIQTYRRRLRPDGVLAINMITDKPHRPLLKRTRAALMNEFPCHASITAPRGFNQAVIAGAQLNKTDNVKIAEDVFAHPEDRKLWRRMKMRAS